MHLWKQIRKYTFHVAQPVMFEFQFKRFIYTQIIHLNHEQMLY